MKVLLITYYYPPDRAVGGQRAAKVAAALREAGHDVTILAAGDPNSAVPRGLRRISPLPTIRDAYAAMRELFRPTDRRGGVAEQSSRDGREETAETPTWKRWVFSLIWLPDDRQGIILPVVCTGARLSERPDVIYTTAPPFSIHLSGLLLKAITGAEWVAEFRDPWTANPWKPAHLRSALSDWVEKKLESLCLERSDLLVSVSEGIDDRLAETGAATPRVTVRNGIEDISTPDASSTRDGTGQPFTIVHAGSFYHARDPFPFLKGVEHLVNAGSLDPAVFRVRLIGATDAYEGRSISDHLRQSRLEGHVQLEGWMSPDEALECVQAADALLLLALNQPDQVPNKLYEYLGARRPILAIADECGETARMLRRVGGHRIVSTNDPERIHAALRDLLEDRREGPVGDGKVLEDWRTRTQMNRLLEAVANYVAYAR